MLTLCKYVEEVPEITNEVDNVLFKKLMTDGDFINIKKKLEKLFDDEDIIKLNLHYNNNIITTPDENLSNEEYFYNEDLDVYINISNKNMLNHDQIGYGYLKIVE